MKMYDWEFFWVTGRSARMPVPFGPEAPDNRLTLESEWLVKLDQYYPKLREVAGTLPFDYILVQAPREALPEEEHHWNMKGYK